MPSYVSVIDPSGEVSIGIENIILEDDDAHVVDPPLIRLLGAKDIIDSGKNVIVRPSNKFYRNECYVNQWNRYAESRNLWVRFEGDEGTVTASAHDAVMIIVMV